MKAHTLLYSLVLVSATLGLSDGAAAQVNAQKLRIVRSNVTGSASFVTAKDGGPLLAPVKQAAKGVQNVRHAAALNAISTYGPLFGVTNSATQLTLQSTRLGLLSRTTTTFKQVHRGIPVFTGMLKVHEDFTGAVLVMNGDIHQVPDKLSVKPTLAAADAVKAAKDLMPLDPAVEKADLVIVDPGWYGDPPVGAHLAYHVILTNDATASREAFFIDAHTGRVLDQWTMVYSARDRRIYDGQAAASVPGVLVRSEGGAAVGTPIDVDRAYDYYGDTYDYYSRAFGRDSIDGVGLPLVATVNSTAPGCPNAFWSGSIAQMVFCADTVTDDVVGHELTHGVTEHTSGLIYQNQSGQLNESLSDIFGEMIDLFNGDAAFAGTPGGTPWPVHATGPGLDTPNNLRSACSLAPAYPDGVRWLVGEDATAFGGAIRDMFDPTCKNSPDRANSPLQTCNIFDSGGVHVGSGVPNHAFAFLTDGGTFNGFTISGIGPIKSGAVWYRAQSTYFTPGTDFQDARAALIQAAADLVGTFPNDPRTGSPSASMFTSADASEVDMSLLATEMDTVGRCGDVRHVLDSTLPAQCADRSMIFTEDFEAGLGAWTVTNSAPPTPYDWVTTSNLAIAPFFCNGGPENGKRCTTAADCIGFPCLPTPSMVAHCADIANACPGAVTGGTDETAFHRLDSPVINIPASVNFPTLAFDHLILTEPNFDGGNVKISVNGGAFQLISASDFYFNAYNRTLFTGSNPIGGQAAFTDAGGGWGTSLIYLGRFISGGESIRIRFEFGKDVCAGGQGWFVDHVQLYDCTTVTDCNNNNAPDELEPINSPPPNVVVQNPSTHASCFWSDVNSPGSSTGTQSVANRFQLLTPKTISQFKVSGVYINTNTPPATDNFVVVFMDDTLTPIETRTTSSVRQLTGFFLFTSFDEYEFTLTLSSPVALPAGVYWVEVYNDLTSIGETFCWSRSLNTVGVVGTNFASEAPGVSWTCINNGQSCMTNDMALELIAVPDAAAVCITAPILAAAPMDLPKMKYLSFNPSVNGTMPVQIKVTNVSTGKLGYVSRGAITNGLVVAKHVVLVSTPPPPEDWSGVSLVNVTGCIIQPGEAYEVTAIDPVTGTETLPLLMTTVDRWGNVNADSVVDIVDVVAAIASFSSQGTSGPVPAPHSDVTGNEPEGGLDIADVVGVIFFFTTQGDPLAGNTPLGMCP